MVGGEIHVPSGWRSTPPVARQIASRRDMRSDECLRGGRVMPEMDVDIVASAVGGDLGDGAVDHPRPGRAVHG